LALLHSDLDRARALSIIRERVRLRFALSADTFVDRVLGLPVLANCGGATLADQLRALALDDLYLATACSHGDEDAWREFQDTHFPFIRDFARRANAQQADDTAAQVIADLWQRKKIDQFEGRSRLRTWLGAVVIRTSINAASGSAHKFLSLDDPGASILPERPLQSTSSHAEEDAKLLAGLLVRVLERLDAEDRLLLFLYYEEQLTLEQIEPALRSSKATLSRRLKRIRTRLRDDLTGLLRAETGEASFSRVREGLERAGFEFDLSAALGDCLRLLQGNRRGGV
jgi:RNA polymerase sigma-70 factor (ECF subfamily)